MFGIALMGVLTGCVELLAGVCADVFAALIGSFGSFCVAPALGCAQGLEFIMGLSCQACMTCLRVLTCGCL